MDSNEADRWALASELLEQLLDLPEDQQPEAVSRLSMESGVERELERLFEGTRQQSILDAPLESLVDRLPLARMIRDAMSGRPFGG